MWAAGDMDLGSAARRSSPSKRRKEQYLNWEQQYVTDMQRGERPSKKKKKKKKW